MVVQRRILCPEAQRARRLHAFLTFYGPGGFATPDDVTALENVQQGFAAWRDVEWNDLSRGMARNDEQLDTDEGHLRVFWRRWSWLDASVMSGPSRLKPVAVSASGSCG